MIEETALILNCDGEYADIETKPQSSCGGCASSGVCGTGVFSKVFGNRKTVVRVVNTLKAKPGEQVIIGLQESALSRVSMVFYLVPIISMILAALLGQEMAIRLGYVSQDPLAILGGAIGLFAGLWLVRVFSRTVEADSRYQPVMLRLATSEKVVFDREPKLPA
ncbi:MAG: SoxR reducing system RseC family protein [Gammaproteobacteria bacterium]|nr:SoxR reducing system RseC family protein [Gammaproteobacteria bacterium]